MTPTTDAPGIFSALRRGSEGVDIPAPSLDAHPHSLMTSASGLVETGNSTSKDAGGTASEEAKRLGRAVRNWSAHVRPATEPPARSGLIEIESWEGVVEEVFDTYFLARIISLTRADGDEIAEIYASEVSPSDRPLLREGAIFYWTIGYEDTPSGQRKRQSFLRFRRLPPIAASNHETTCREDEWLT